MHCYMVSQANQQNRTQPPLSAKPRKSLEQEWKKAHGCSPPKGISTLLLARAASYDAQVRQLGELARSTRKILYTLTDHTNGTAIPKAKPSSQAGTRLAREWHGKTHVVDIGKSGVVYQRKTYRSLSEVARVITGTRWSGPRFFGL
jgi:DUF2924 family protein